MRKDSWTEDNDKLLTETVLNCVRTGESQLEAFEYVSEKLGRSTAACGFRWNSALRKLHEDELKQAKIEGREFKKNNKRTRPDYAPEPPVTTQDGNPYNTVAQLLNGISEAFRTLQNENDSLRREIVRLEKQLEDIPKSEDLQDFFKFLTNAKKNGLWDIVNKDTPAS